MSVDPLAALAEAQEPIHRRLLEITAIDREELAAAWQATAEEPNSGRYLWQLSPNQPFRVYLRLIAFDAAGNLWHGPDTGTGTDRLE